MFLATLNPSVSNLTLLSRSRRTAVRTRSASDDAIIGIALEPRRPVDRCSNVALVPDIFHPFPDIAVHVEKPKRVGPERSNRRGLQHRGATATVAVGVSSA